MEKQKKANIKKREKFMTKRILALSLMVLSITGVGACGNGGPSDALEESLPDCNVTCIGDAVGNSRYSCYDQNEDQSSDCGCYYNSAGC